MTIHVPVGFPLQPGLIISITIIILLLLHPEKQNGISRSNGKDKTKITKTLATRKNPVSCPLLLTGFPLLLNPKPHRGESRKIGK
jgi:hypothetical protein